MALNMAAVAGWRFSIRVGVTSHVPTRALHVLHAALLPACNAWQPVPETHEPRSQHAPANVPNFAQLGVPQPAAPPLSQLLAFSLLSRLSHVPIHIQSLCAISTRQTMVSRPFMIVVCEPKRAEPCDGMTACRCS